MPVGAYGGRRDVMECVAPLGSVYQAGTLSGNPLAMTAGVETLKIIEELGLPEGLSGRRGPERFADGMADAANGRRESRSSAACCGSMFGAFFQGGPVRKFLRRHATRILTTMPNSFILCYKRGVWHSPRVSSKWGSCLPPIRMRAWRPRWPPRERRSPSFNSRSSRASEPERYAKSRAIIHNGPIAASETFFLDICGRYHSPAGHRMAWPGWISRCHRKQRTRI